MKQENRRNTAKEKQIRNRGFPYCHKFNEIKWKITDDDGKEYGRFREKVNARNEIERLKKELLIEDLGVEEI